MKRFDPCIPRRVSLGAWTWPRSLRRVVQSPCSRSQRSWARISDSFPLSWRSWWIPPQAAEESWTQHQHQCPMSTTKLDFLMRKWTHIAWIQNHPAHDFVSLEEPREPVFFLVQDLTHEGDQLRHEAPRQLKAGQVGFHRQKGHF